MIKDENFITIQGWMIHKLQLKGNELLIYAIIYGFTQLENQKFTGSLNYLAEWTNSTKQGVIKALKSLVDKGLIEKHTEQGVNLVYYTTKFNESGKQSLTGWSTKFNEGGKQSLPNNINDNILYSSDSIQKQKNTNKKVLCEVGTFYIDNTEEYCPGYSHLVDQLSQEKRDILQQWFLDRFKGKYIDHSFVKKIVEKTLNEQY